MKKNTRNLYEDGETTTFKRPNRRTHEDNNNKLTSKCIKKVEVNFKSPLPKKIFTFNIEENENSCITITIADEKQKGKLSNDLPEENLGEHSFISYENLEDDLKKQAKSKENWLLTCIARKVYLIYKTENYDTSLYNISLIEIEEGSKTVKVEILADDRFKIDSLEIRTKVNKNEIATHEVNKLNTSQYTSFVKIKKLKYPFGAPAKAYVLPISTSALLAGGLIASASLLPLPISTAAYFSFLFVGICAGAAVIPVSAGVVLGLALILAAGLYLYRNRNDQNTFAYSMLRVWPNKLGLSGDPESVAKESANNSRSPFVANSGDQSANRLAIDKSV